MAMRFDAARMRFDAARMRSSRASATVGSACGCQKPVRAGQATIRYSWISPAEAVGTT